MTIMYKQRLLTPGPTAVPEQVLLEMAQPIIHHRTKAFQAIFADLSKQLQWLFCTRSPVLSIAGSGTTAYEAAMVSLVKPGSKVLTISGGKFGERWSDIYDSYGVENIKLTVDWGCGCDVAAVEQALKDHPTVSVVTVVHSETSTATVSDVKALAAVVAKTDAILIADGITAVGAMPVKMDEWGIDVVVSGSQKAMMLPPGLGFVALGERAQARLAEGKGLPVYNLDLRKWLSSWKKNDVPFTPPVSLIRGQRVALAMLQEQGLESVWHRTAKLAEATRAALGQMGVQLISQSPSDSVTGAFYPEGVDDSLRAAMRDAHGIHLAGGQDGRGAKWKGAIFRINHMGYVDGGDTLATLAALETELLKRGVQFERGSAVAKATAVLFG